MNHGDNDVHFVIKYMYYIGQYQFYVHNQQRMKTTDRPISLCLQNDLPLVEASIGDETPRSHSLMQEPVPPCLHYGHFETRQ